MGLKSFKELYDLDVSSDLKKKPTFYKDRNGKMIPTSEDKWLDYLEWARVIVLLHENGAEDVKFWSQPVQKLEGVSVPYLRCFILIDEKESFIDFPIIDGNRVLSNPNQFQIHKAELRGFVKCVAVNTGLGLKLWLKDETWLNQEPEGEIEQPAKESKVVDNTLEFASWQHELDQCTTKAEMFTLYKNNKEAIEASEPIKKLFKLAEIKLKGGK